MPAARNAITAADTKALEYEPVHSKIQPAPAAPSAEPTWWAKKIQPESSPTEKRP